MTAYTMLGTWLHFRAAAFGSVVRRAGAHPVTMQVDDGHQDREPTWTVSVVGTPTRVTEAATLGELWAAPRTRVWELGVAPQWLTLGTDDIKGRRVRS
ncbi:hypothetical protein NOCARDAX2BIS_610004 [Nocardioides sp. AX2bis]|nr:hypothetical protein NOCARDAX2BIS_610004 [Nocardioides sp. AX2bis]